jgi:hypothetical protein
MDFALIELIMWAGLIFFFWVLKDNLGRVESDIEEIAAKRQRLGDRLAASLAYARPEKLQDPIGSYKGQQIFRYAIINGKNYQFDHVLPAGCPTAEGECCVAPGLVYVACQE